MNKFRKKKNFLSYSFLVIITGLFSISCSSIKNHKSGAPLGLENNSQTKLIIKEKCKIENGKAIYGKNR